MQTRSKRPEINTTNHQGKTRTNQTQQNKQVTLTLSPTKQKIDPNLSTLTDKISHILNAVNGRPYPSGPHYPQAGKFWGEAEGAWTTHGVGTCRKTKIDRTSDRLRQERPSHIGLDPLLSVSAMDRTADRLLCIYTEKCLCHRPLKAAQQTVCLNTLHRAMN